MPQICPGICNNAWRRAEQNREATGTEHHIQPTWGQPTQCHDCVNLTRHRLAELPELLTAAHLEALYATHSKLVGTIGRTSVIAAFPGQTARLLIDETLREMRELEGDILVRRGIWQAEDDTEPDPAVREGHAITTTISILLAHWDWAMQHHPAADEPWVAGNANPGGQASRWHNRLQVFTKRDKQREVKRLAPCPRCHGPYLAESTELRLVDDRPYIECKDPDCRRVMTSAEYDHYVKTMVGAIDRTNIAA